MRATSMLSPAGRRVALACPEQMLRAASTWAFGMRCGRRSALRWATSNARSARRRLWQPNRPPSALRFDGSTRPSPSQGTCYSRQRSGIITQDERQPLVVCHWPARLRWSLVRRRSGGTKPNYPSIATAPLRSVPAISGQHSRQRPCDSSVMPTYLSILACVPRARSRR